MRVCQMAAIWAALAESPSRVVATSAAIVQKLAPVATVNLLGTPVCGDELSDRGDARGVGAGEGAVARVAGVAVGVVTGVALGVVAGLALGVVAGLALGVVAGL